MSPSPHQRYSGPGLHWHLPTCSSFTQFCFTQSPNVENYVIKQSTRLITQRATDDENWWKVWTAAQRFDWDWNKIRKANSWWNNLKQDVLQTHVPFFKHFCTYVEANWTSDWIIRENGNRGTAPLFLNSGLGGGERSTWPLYLRERTPVHIQQEGGLVPGPVRCFRDQKICCPCTDSNPDRPSGGPSLYTDCTHYILKTWNLTDITLRSVLLIWTAANNGQTLPSATCC